MLFILLLALFFAGTNAAPTVAKSGTVAAGSEVVYTWSTLTDAKDYTVTLDGVALDIFTSVDGSASTDKVSTDAETLNGRAVVTSTASLTLKLTITLICADDGKVLNIATTGESVDETITFASKFIPTAFLAPASIKVGDNVNVFAVVCGTLTDAAVITVTCGKTTQSALGKATVKANGDLVSTTAADMDTDAAPAIGKAGGTDVTTLTSFGNYYKVAIKDFQSDDNEKICKFTVGTSTDVASVTLKLESGAPALTCGFSLVLALAVAAKELMFV